MSETQISLTSCYPCSGVDSQILLDCSNEYFATNLSLNDDSHYEALEKLIEPSASGIIVSSGQAALALALITLRTSGHRFIGIDEMSYPHALTLCRSLGFEIFKLKENNNVEEFQRLIKYGCRLFYLMPQMHNPRGTYLSTIEVQNIASLIERSGSIVIEDAAYAHISNNQSSFLDYLKNQTFKITSLTKMISKRLHAGLLEYPSLYKEIVLQTRTRYGFGVSPHSICVINCIIKKGLLERLIEAKRQEGLVRKKLAFDLAGITVTNGWYSMVELPCEGSTFTHALSAYGVTVSPGSAFHIESAPTNSIRISLGGETNRSRLAEGLRRLGKLLNNYHNSIK